MAFCLEVTSCDFLPHCFVAPSQFLSGILLSDLFRLSNAIQDFL